MRKPARTKAQRHARIAPVAALILSACTLEATIPGYDPQISDRARAADWPELADQSIFTDDPAPLTGETTPEDIAARAEALRLRALLLQRPVLSPEDEERLQSAGQG